MGEGAGVLAADESVSTVEDRMRPDENHLHAEAMMPWLVGMIVLAFLLLAGVGVGHFIQWWKYG